MIDYTNADLSQKVGATLGGFIGAITGDVMAVIINTAVGAVVGFIVTTLCKYAWEKIKQKFGNDKADKELSGLPDRDSERPVR